MLRKPGTATTVMVSIPSLIVICIAIRNYCSNVIAAQQFTRTIGVTSVILAFVLFLVVIGGGVGILSILSEYTSVKMNIFLPK
jgi:hypothetical protein